jgi:hypothetical protein
MVSEIDPHDPAAILARVRAQAAARNLRVSQHAEDAMFDDAFTSNDIRSAIASGQVLENYPLYHRGPCCLLVGNTSSGRPMHIVCSTTRHELVIITVHEPTLPKWQTPTQRRK